MLEILTLISSVVGVLCIAHYLNTTLSSAAHWLKFRSFPKNIVELELTALKEKNEFITREYDRVQE
jgi:hypothetical protein